MAKQARPGNNGLDPEKVERFVSALEEINADLDKLRSEHMLRCKSKHEERKDILAEAADAGINKKALKAAVEQRALERRAKNIPNKLDLDEQSQLDMIRHALGDYIDTPLGQAAAASVAANGAQPTA